MFTPELVDQAVGRDDLIGVKREHGKQCPLPYAAQRDRRAMVDPNLKRPEQPQLKDRPHAEKVTGQQPAHSGSERTASACDRTLARFPHPCLLTSNRPGVR